MSSYRIGLVRYENFGPFEDVLLDFSLPGLTGIDGSIEWKPGSDSNGSGKSMLLEGPAWALFARGIRENFKGDDVVRLGSTGGCCVQVDVDGGEHPIVVRRYRAHPKHKNRLFLFVADEDVSRGTDPETQHALEDLLGIDFHTFCNSVAFGAREDVRSFFAASDATRKVVLERMLGLELYARAQQVARQRLVEESKLAVATQSKVEKAEAKLEQALQDAQVVSMYGDLEDLEFDVQKARLNVHLHSRTVDKQEALVVAAKKDLEHDLSAESAVRALWEADCEANEEARGGLQKEVQRLKGLAVQANTQWKVLRIRRDKLESLEQECPTCGQEVSEATKVLLLADLADAMDAAEEARSVALQQVGETEELLDAIVDPEWVPGFEGQLAGLVLQASKSDFADAKSAYVEAQALCKGATALWEKAQAHHDYTEDQVDALVQSLDADVESYEKAQAHLAQVEFWVEGFGNKGLKSFLIEAAIPNINARATKYAQALLGSGVKVKLSATTKLKSKDAVREKLTVEGSIPGCCSSYAGASKGQKRRLDLSLLLAFREIVSERSATPFDQFFADELFDGLDKSGCESVAALLHDLSEDRPVVLVTHSPWLKSSVDRLVMVRHVEKFRAIVEVPKVAPKPGKKTPSKSARKKLKAKLAAKPKV